jgi:hypothetical protein
VVASNCETICCAFATPADAALVDEAPVLAVAELAVAELPDEAELELPLELQAARTAAAVIAAPGASQRFHLCVIAFGSSIPPITSGA